MLVLGLILLGLALKPLIFKSKDWRSSVGLDKNHRLDLSDLILK